MPVSGNEDKSGVIARQSSNCSAGVPIKKRRFPVIRHTSPPPQEHVSLHVENDSLQKERSNPSQESSLSDASVVTNSPGISDANKSSFPKDGPSDSNINPVQNSVHFTRVKREAPSLPICSGSIDNMDSKMKLLVPEKSVRPKISENTKLQLAPNEEFAPNCGEGIAMKRKVGMNCKLELSTAVGNAELSLGLKEPPIPSLAGQNSEQNRQTPEEADAPSFSLSLGKGIPITGSNGDDLKLDDENCLHANRSNWDLNTTMDAWEGSVGDAASGHGAVGFDCSNGIGGTNDVKPSTISSTGIFGISSNLGEQTTRGGEQRSNIPIPSLCSSTQYKPDDALHLRLSTLPPCNFSGENSSSSTEVASSSFVSNSNFKKVLAPTGNTLSVGRTVKSESHDENATHDIAKARGDAMRSLDSRTVVKHEVLERSSVEALKMSNTSPNKLGERIPIKSELVQDNQETQRTAKETYQSDGKVVQCEKNGSPKMVMPLNPHKPCPSELATCSTELSMSGNTPNQPEYSDITKAVNINNATPNGRGNIFNQVASETVVTHVDHQSKGSIVSDGKTETSGTKVSNVEDSDTCGLKMVNDHPPGSHGYGEGSVSDEEKFNVSTDMLEEDSYGSDYVSDDNHAVVTRGDAGYGQFREDDDEVEDGEFREQLLHTSSEGPIVEKREAENSNLGDCDIRNVDLGSTVDGTTTESGVNEKETKLKDHSEISDEHIKECVDAVINEKASQGVDKDGSGQESLTVEVAVAGSDEKSHINNTPRKLLDQSGGKDFRKGHEMEVSSAGAPTGSQGSVTTGEQALDGNNKGTETPGKADSIVPKTDPSLNVDAAAKDANTGGNRSRIITLPRATNVSPGKTRPFPGRSFPSRSGRERYSDFDGEKLHPRGNRDEPYIDGPRKYTRERFQDQSFRNSRPNFMRGRGRVSGRLNTQRGNWDSDRDFASEIYNSPADYRFSRHKRVSADGELDYDASIGTGRGGRKPLTDELPSFRHPLSRRYSPGGRDGPATRGTQMVSRIPRNLSPSRRMGDDRSDMVGLRRGEKFMRGLPDDSMGPVFTRPQRPYEGVDSQFVRGNRNFLPVQRRGLPRIRSKSPIRSRTRSPGPWSSPRRRSPDGFNELTHRRSPPIYRRERMRSPNRPCFPEEMVGRRRISPSYISRPGDDLRDIESGRDHGHLRSAMSNRSPSDQVLPRSNRRFDILDPRERTDADEFFGDAMRPGRFHELGSSDGNGDERRKSGDGRGPARSFRPPYNDADAENFRFQVEDGPRPFRFRPEADPEFLERNDLREREFDGRINNRSVNAPRRTRNMDEQEGNYRHGGQMWHDDGFDDVSRGKRRRFVT